MNGDMVDELFGKAETNINVLGWLIRKPEASLFEAMTNNHIPGGICFGMAYSGLEFQRGLISPAAFPHTGGNDVWHLDSSTAPSNPLLRFVTERFSLQFTDQLIPAELHAVLDLHRTDDDIEKIKAELAQGYPVLLGLIRFVDNPDPPFVPSIEGHTVLAYDTHQLPDGSTSIDVANSNIPYNTEEESKSALHDEREFTKSQVIIKDGHWTFPEGADFKGSNGMPWSGSESDLVVYKHTELPIVNGQQPSLPSVFAALPMVAFGSSGDGVTQLSDGHGSLFRAHRLAPQSSWPRGVAPIADFTGAPGSPQLFSFDPKRARTLAATVKRSKGGGAMNMNLPGLQASLLAGTDPGQVDQVSVDPHGDSIGYRTSVSGTGFGGTLLASPGRGRGAKASAASSSALSDRLVRFQTTTGRKGGEQLSFPSGRKFVLHHAGKAAKLALTLSAFDASGRPVAVKLPPIRLAAGETLGVAPTNWRKLGSSSVRIEATVRGRTAVRRVHGRAIGRRFATLRRASLVSLGEGKYGAALVLGVHHAPKQGWLSLAGTLLRRGHRVERTTPIQLAGPTLRAGKVHLALPKRPPGGRYSLRVRALEVTASGAIQGSRTVTRTFGLKAATH